MPLNNALAARLREVFLDGRWIANTNYQEQLTRLTWEEATRKFGDFNSVAQLTYHINYYLDGLLRAFKTGHLDISDKFSFDLPIIQTAEDWQKLRTAFLHNAATFADYVEELDDMLLNAPFINPKYGTLLRNIEGMIEHSYYHLGQIVLLMKLLSR